MDEHFVGNISFLKCDECNVNMQMNYSDIAVTCPVCEKEMEPVTRPSWTFTKSNDYYGTTVSC